MKNKTKQTQELHNLLRGMNIERAGTRDVSKSSIKFSILQKDYDKEGNEYYKEVKNVWGWRGKRGWN